MMSLIFVYATKENVSEYMVKSGITYRAVTDHLGSPSMVINATSGEIISHFDYDEYGNVIYDTNPDFQPFGFCGGLYETKTKLTRFGARDYDAETGRWTKKDPVLFNSSSTNVFNYVDNDPEDSLDLNGLSKLEFRERDNLLLLYDDCGNLIGIFVAGNKTTNPLGDPYIVGSNGPAPNVTFPIQEPVYTGNSQRFGSYFFPIGTVGPNGERLDIARQRGIGLHAGKSGPNIPTQGCIRVSEQTLQYHVSYYYQEDVITQITITERP